MNDYTGHNHCHPPANGSDDKFAMCPVMHMLVNKEEAKAHGLTRTYKGQVYYLCCNSCVSTFDKQPQQYAKEQGHNGGQGTEHEGHDHHAHVMANGKMSLWQKFKISMTMTMGMDHTGLAGREMAKMMELDIKRKFFFALIMSVPIIAYSPLGERILGVNLPQPIAANWILLILTTPVFFYAGWIFLYSSYYALKAKILNMAVLIAVGISAAYFASIALTITGSSDSYYEAAVLLITFVLFGHWMEMKSRRGTTDALQALFDLVPPQARVIRTGKETLVPTSEVQLGDVLVLKPGDSTWKVSSSKPIIRWYIIK